jgi:hypothetical protein
MHVHRFIFACVIVTFGHAALADDLPAKKFTVDERKFFLNEIQPLLKAKCFGCHGEGKTLESGYDMRTRAGLIAGGDNGAAVVPGKADESPLYQMVLREGELKMPPQERNALDILEIDALRRWIDMGLPWADDVVVAEDDWNNPDGVRVATTGGLDPTWTSRRYKAEEIWAYRPIEKVEVPRVLRDGQPIAHPIDAFLQQKLDEKNITPAGQASGHDWLRRATFDLIGLPPTPDEIADFQSSVRGVGSGGRRQEKPSTSTSPILGSRSPIDSVIDRLLASPHYGERMMQHWGDVVRYADSGGFSADWERPHNWRYRDYVIRSFNGDKPYNQFVVEQIAGDELDPDDPEMRIAASFLRMGPWEHTSMSIPEVTRQQWLDDVTNAVGVTFLATGMTCFQCHDHKFDPLPTRDYYRMQAAFATTRFTRPPTPFLPEERTEDLPRLREEIEKIAAAKDWMTTDSPDSFTLYHVKDKRGNYMKIARWRCDANSFTVRTGGNQEISILRGGSLEAPAEVVTPGVLSAVRFSDETPAPEAWDLPESLGGRRLALAMWITHPRNPLTPRVIVNRVWQMHFGRGLVATPNNFGTRGARPTHPELLDWLAGWFVDNGWSLKKLHRLIMTSEAYRRAAAHPEAAKLAEIDPKNELLAYFTPRRLTAEEIRDAMLAASGELNPVVGGPHVFPEINWEAAMQPRHIVGTIAPAYQPSPTKSDRDRRSVYCFRCRTLVDPLMDVLNKPSSEISCDRRDETTVTPQVFAMFNSESVHARALALADRLMRSSHDPHERVRLAFQNIYGRDPTRDEQVACESHVLAMTAHHEKHTPVRRELPTSVKRETIDQHTGAPVRWEEKLHWLIDYERDLMPWEVDAKTRGLAELCLVLFNSNEFVYVY